MENTNWQTPATKKGEEFEMIAKTFQGLETVLATELIDLGANNIQIGRRMVSFTGNKELLYRAIFQLRTAIRILMPIKHFRATSADEVYEAVQQIDWTNYLTNKTTFAVDSVVFSQEFRHSKFVAYKVKDAIVDQMREQTGDRPNIRVTNPDLQLHIHIAEYDCTLSLDTSGESLHRRGYRQETVEAPLNEVLAAGIIMLTGWKGECDLIDPMCGSGTIPIEAALIARNIAPGVFRKEFAFEKWVDFDQDLFDSIYNDDSQEREFNHKIYGYDNNPKANEIAIRNVKAAGLSKEIELKLQPFQQFEQPKEKSIIITNPPYGERISTDDLLGLYKMIGERLKHAFAGNDAWILSYRDECFDQIGLKPSVKIELYNGALECQFRKYQLFDGKYKAFRQENEGKEFKPRRDDFRPRRNADKPSANRGRFEGERKFGDRRFNGKKEEGDRRERTFEGKRFEGKREERRFENKKDFKGPRKFDKKQ
jgi:putative N6-adenine-specific DNA methylase